MDAARLLAEYLRRHDDGVRTGDFAPLAALFADDGVFAFRGQSALGALGSAEILRLFRERGPDDTLVAGEILAESGRRAHAIYGWSAAPGLVEGTLRLEAGDGRIVRLEVIARRGGPAAPRERRAARAIIVAPADEPRVLLLRSVEPMTDARWWITPGGGLEPGEDWETAARREIAEEVGHLAGPLGPCVWTREHTFLWNHNVVRQQEQYFLLEVPQAFPPAPMIGADRRALEGLEKHRWWTVRELAASDEQVFSPRRFAVHLAALLRDGRPAAPIDTGV